jgi:hypothetical protein
VVQQRHRGKREKLAEDDVVSCILFIEDREVVKTILQHLGLWLIRSRPPAKAHAPPARECAMDGSRYVFPDDAVYGDPDYPWDAYITT